VCGTTPALDRKVPLLPHGRSISLSFLLTFSPLKVHLLYSLRKGSVRNPGNLPVRVLDLKKPEEIRSHWKKERKKEKGFGSWLLRYQKEKQILGLARSCASLVNT
jgi:hypothetical protein